MPTCRESCRKLLPEQAADRAGRLRLCTSARRFGRARGGDHLRCPRRIAQFALGARVDRLQLPALHRRASRVAEEAQDRHARSAERRTLPFATFARRRARAAGGDLGLRPPRAGNAELTRDDPDGGGIVSGPQAREPRQPLRVAGRGHLGRAPAGTLSAHRPGGRTALATEPAREAKRQPRAHPCLRSTTAFLAGPVVTSRAHGSTSSKRRSRRRSGRPQSRPRYPRLRSAALVARVGQTTRAGSPGARTS